MTDSLLTRRTLLGAAGAAAAWWALPVSAQKGPRVVVVGAGLAGLTAAYELQRAGFDVTVLEARDRVGGRVHTVRFGDGQHAEAGGEWIDTGHRHLLGYLKRFGIPLEDTRRTGPDGESIAYFDGRRRNWDKLYTGDVQRQLNRWYSRVNRLSRRVNPLEPWRAPAELDRRSVGDLIDEVGLTGMARRLASEEEIRDDYCVRPDQLSLVFHLHFARLMWNQSESGTEVLRVRGGADRLPRALADRIGVELSSPVTEISQRGKRVDVVTSGRTFTADHCVIAAPLPALRDVGLEAPARVSEAIGQVQYGTGTKNLLAYKRSFWRERGLTGDTLTDLPLGTTWEATNRVLVAYSVGRRVTEGPGPSVTQLDRIYPGSRDFLEGSERITWQDERYTGGTYTAFAPGQITRYWEALRRPFGRIHLAGEHTSLYTGYMEGAVRSGKRVAHEVLRRASSPAS